MKNQLLPIAVFLLTPWGNLRATETPIDFVRDVRPIFERHCYECHGDSKQKSGLRLDVKGSAFKGGDGYGQSILPNKANESPLIQLVSSNEKDERMPPNGDGLSATEIETLTRWIHEGAVWPDGVDTTKLKETRDHWSFKPISVASGIHSIDSFIQTKLEEHGLNMSPETDRVSWIRRVSLDLTGLPPAPEDIQAFVDDVRVDALEHVVDSLLKSPRYGERWAQHWLDVVRYADTHGFEVNTERPNAWPYRDYVIRAFNDDTPYDRFIREQIVGDAMGEDAATGFLVTASVLLSGQIGKDAPSIRLARQDSLDEIVNNIGQTFLGLSIGCARCHDHKFDPIRAKDYYSMQAFVAGVEYADRKMRTPETEARTKEAEPLRLRLTEIEASLAQFSPIARPGTQRQVTNAKRNEEAFQPIDAGLVADKLNTLSEVLPLHPTLCPSFATIGLSPDDAVEAKRLLAEKGSLEKKIKSADAGQLAFAGNFRSPDEIHLLSRGDPEQPKEEVFPAVLSAFDNVRLSKETPEQERRRTLADWIASPDNPLTARVMMNRIWQGHFGAGIVPTPSDFGNNGMKATHPELLDWLATEFIRSGWSVKSMHRMIVLSQTYRQRSNVVREKSKVAQQIDSDVRLLWRFPSRRLEAESIRDSMLAISGQLNLKMYGRGYDLFDQRGGLTGFKPVESFEPENQRRMIYAHKVRREPEAVFGAFDCPDAGQSTALRRASTTPIQALNLFNSRFTLDASDAFASRVKVDVGDDLSNQIARAYQLAFGRTPTTDERQDIESVVGKHGLSILCRAIFNSNEFLFIP